MHQESTNNKARILPIVLYQNEKLGDINTAEIDIDDSAEEVEEDEAHEKDEKGEDEESESESDIEFDAKSNREVDKHVTLSRSGRIIKAIVRLDL